MNSIDINNKAELVRADTALQSFRDAGYSFGDAVGEIVDNAIQAGARKIKFNWHFDEVKAGKSAKPKREIKWLSIADNGQGISPDVLPHVLTVGFSTRYNNRDGIGRFGVGFKLASISQARRLEIYTRPAYLKSKLQKDDNEKEIWTYEQKNSEGRIFMSYLDLDEIASHKQQNYVIKELKDFPPQYKAMMEDKGTGTLVVWDKIDRMNETKAFSESADEKLADLSFFLSRTYRIYIDKGINIYLPDKSRPINQFFEPLSPYDPCFQITNPIANHLAKGEEMKGELIENGKLKIDGEDVEWRIFLTPKVTRLAKGGGGTDGPSGNGQFKKLHIPDNQGKISFLRYNREISYVKVPHLLPPDDIDKNRNLDRFIAIEVYFSPVLDEYFQVKHIKRGVEPVNKLKNELKKVLEKPIITARKKIREVWKETEESEMSKKTAENASGGRNKSEQTAKQADAGMPLSIGGQTVTPQEENNALKTAAIDAGITDPEKQNDFVQQAKQMPMVALDLEWNGRGLLDIQHLNSTVLVKINRRHPFIKGIYLPLKEALEKEPTPSDSDFIQHLLQSAIEGIDLLFFAYAKAESMSQNPEDKYLELREDWGKFAAVYLNKREELNIA